MSLAKRARSSVAALLLCAAASPALADGCRHQTLMPAFEAFLAQHQDATPEAKGQAFARDFALRFPEFYGAPLFGDPDKLAGKAARFLDPAVRPQFGSLPPFDMTSMIERGRTIDETFTSAQASFLKEFPDFRCDTFVAYGPSLFHFDGHVYDSPQGEPRLLFGMDLITMIHTGPSVAAFFQHELFHIHHSAVLGDAQPSDNEPPVWWALWREGLATYVSQRMNPHLSLQEVLWFPADLAEKAAPRRAEIAAHLLADMENRNDRYALYFLAGDGPDGLPARSGYYMGYWLAKELGDGRPLAELARMTPAEVRKATERFLRREAGGDTPEVQPSATR